jgi:mevalonate kinase
VKEFMERKPKFAAEIDLKMAKSVKLAEAALAMENQEKALPMLTQAINLGYNCFKTWGLTSGIVDNHIRLLKEAGSLAAKPSGSGGGGYVISLWDKEPPAELAASLLKL